MNLKLAVQLLCLLWPTILVDSNDAELSGVNLNGTLQFNWWPLFVVSAVVAVYSCPVFTQIVPLLPSVLSAVICVHCGQCRKKGKRTKRNKWAKASAVWVSEWPVLDGILTLPVAYGHESDSSVSLLVPVMHRPHFASPPLSLSLFFAYSFFQSIRAMFFAFSLQWSGQQSVQASAVKNRSCLPVGPW